MFTDGRLELAQAIADPMNPLTARVIVNRIWSHHFGVGLVSTPSDFGTRSEPPTHPQLVDWLAQHFIADGWSIKRMHRLILLSAVYQQSAQTQDDHGGAAGMDPANRWLGRFPRMRLDFEALRDSILSATGELDLRAGGKAFDLESAPEIPRRSVYGRIDRKFLPAVLRSFDFANPDMHAPQRHATTVPQQALYLLNSDWVFDRATALSRRVETRPDKDLGSQLELLYRCVFQRAPSARERALGVGFLQGSSADADSGSNSSRLAQLAQVLLLSNEFTHVE